MSRNSVRTPAATPSEPLHPALAALAKLSDGPSEQPAPSDQSEIEAAWQEVETDPDVQLAPLGDVRKRWLSTP